MPRGSPTAATSSSYGSSRATTPAPTPSTHRPVGSPRALGLGDGVMLYELHASQDDAPLYEELGSASGPAPKRTKKLATEPTEDAT